MWYDKRTKRLLNSECSLANRVTLHWPSAAVRRLLPESQYRLTRWVYGFISVDEVVQFQTVAVIVIRILQKWVMNRRMKKEKLGMHNHLKMSGCLFELCVQMKRCFSFDEDWIIAKFAVTGPTFIANKNAAASISSLAAQFSKLGLMLETFCDSVCSGWWRTPSRIASDI